MAEMNEEIKAVKATKKAHDPWTDMVKIRLPKAAQGEENFVIAGVNGRMFKIQKGIEVEVPSPIAHVIEHSYELQDKADEYLDSLVNK